MANRNGTYVSFHAEEDIDHIESDLKYYRQIQNWRKDDGKKFQSLYSHNNAHQDHTPASNEMIRRNVQDRLDQSRNVILIISKTTKFDESWLPFELEYAVDARHLPVIAAYVDHEVVVNPNKLRDLWPPALTLRIRSGAAKVIHIPFQQNAIDDAMSQFHPDNMPRGPLDYYSESAHKFFGIMKVLKTA